MAIDFLRVQDKIAISPTLPHELEQLRTFAVETFVESFGHLNTKEDMDGYVRAKFSIEHLEEEYLHPHSRFFFATLHDKVIGYLKINVETAQSECLLDDAMEIERIYVKSTYQSKGVGLELLHFAVEIARKEHYKFIWLGVWEQNLRAIKFYQKHGFQRFDSHQFFLGQDEQTDILMKKQVG